MNNTPPRFGPPILQEDELNKRLLSWYPSHKDSTYLLANLVEEYKRLWRMILSYPHRRVVAPGPVMAVQRVHEFEKETYFRDCMNYFNRFMPREVLAWQGHTDHTGTFDTIMVYKDLFTSDPPRAWDDMSYEIGIKKKVLRLV